MSDIAPTTTPTKTKATPALAGSGAARSRPAGAWALQQRLAPYLFVLPFVVLFAAFTLYPLVRSLVLSTYKTAGPRASEFVGLRNFAFLLTDRMFGWAVLNTLYYAAAYLCLQIPASLGLALLLNDPRVRLRNVFRFAFFSSYLVGGVFVGVVFSLLLAQRGGLVNQVLSLVRPSWLELSWLSKPLLAMPAIVLASLWLGVGYGMIYFLAALQAVDREQYEAAAVDGAGPGARFWHVTLPGIRPVLVFLILVWTIGALQMFELAFVLFQQSSGPNSAGLTIVMYLYQQGFQVGDLGYASAVGWVLVVLISVIALVQLRLTGFARDDG